MYAAVHLTPSTISDHAMSACHRKDIRSQSATSCQPASLYSDTFLTRTLSVPCQGRRHATGTPPLGCHSLQRKPEVIDRRAHGTRCLSRVDVI